MLHAVGMHEHTHDNHRRFWFSSKPLIFTVHIPRFSFAQHTCTQYESPPELPSMSHTCRTCSCVPKWPSASPSLCVMCPLTGITHELPSPPAAHTALFHSTWSFIATGYPEHFTFPSVVLQMCSTGTKQKRKRGRARTAPSQPMKTGPATSSHSCVSSFLFMLTHVYSLPLCCVPKVTADFCYHGSCLKATGRMGLLSLEVCDQRPSVPIDSAQTSTACFFDESCLN